MLRDLNGKTNELAETFIYFKKRGARDLSSQCTKGKIKFLANGARARGGQNKKKKIVAWRRRGGATAAAAVTWTRSGDEKVEVVEAEVEEVVEIEVEEVVSD